MEVPVFKTPRAGCNPNYRPRRLFKNGIPPNLPPTPYMRYNSYHSEKIRDCYPDCKEWNLGRITRRIWRGLSDAGQSTFRESFQADKVEYDKRFKEFVKNRSSVSSVAEQDADEYNSLKEGGGAFIEVAEDEDDFTDNWLDNKHIAYNRFVRNNNLIKAIFSDVKLPKNDRKTLSGLHERVARLRRSGDTFNTYLKRLEYDLKCSEELNKQRMNKIRQSNEDFKKKLKETMMLSKLIAVYSPTKSLSTDYKDQPCHSSVVPLFQHSNVSANKSW